MTTTTPAPRLGRARLYSRRFLRNRSAVVGVAIFLLLVGYALVGGIIAGWDWSSQDFLALTQPPGGGHLFGTNQGGNDVFAQSVHGGGPTAKKPDKPIPTAASASFDYNPQSYDNIRDGGTLRVAVRVIYLNTRAPLLKDVAVRKAILESIDRTKIASINFQGLDYREPLPDRRFSTRSRRDTTTTSPRSSSMVPRPRSGNLTRPVGSLEATGSGRRTASGCS